MRLKSKNNLIIIVCVSSILSMINFALWPVFLIDLRNEWNLTNTDIGWISGAYFFGYVAATPILVGLTDKFDAKLIFLGGCVVGIFGNLGFTFFVTGFWSALLSWAFVGAGLAGTYMPGLQILNSRLGDKERVSAVPWYTSCFGIGTGGSYAVMGLMIINANFKYAAMISIIASLLSICIILTFIKSIPQKSNSTISTRHPLDFRPVLKKKISMSYVLAYGAHTYELFAYRSWCFALFLFIGSKSSPSLSIAMIATLVSLITLTGMIASVLGAKIAERYKRHNFITLIGLSTFFVAMLAACFVGIVLPIAVALLWLYNFFIMLDSGALTAGAVESSDEDNRGAVLAVHSMIGFSGGAIGGPLIGTILDNFGGESSQFAWFCALVAMGFGSLTVFAIQVRHWSNIKAA